MGWEFAVLDGLQRIGTPFLDTVLSAVSALGNAGIFWIVLSALLLCTKKYRMAGLAMGLALLFGFLIGNLTIKPLVARVRPYDVNPSVALLISPPKDFSFPSGHTLSSFAAATALFLNHKKAGAAALALAAVIAFSRMYLYVHYPTDILAGLLIGVAVAFLANAIVRRWIEPRLHTRRA